MRSRQRYLYTVRTHVVRFGLFGLTGCLTPIDIDIANADGIVVIAGQVSNIAGHTVVQLGLTADTERLPIPVSFASVAIIDETEQVSIPLYESTTTAGNYKPDHYEGKPGHAYHVEIEFPDRGFYRSVTDVMPALPGAVQTSHEFKFQRYTDLEGIVSEQPFLFIYADAQLPEINEKLYVRWTAEEVFLLSPTNYPDPFGSVPAPCFVAQSADPQNVILYDGSKIHTRTFEDLLVTERIVDWSFLEKHAFTIYQSTLSSEAHEYWAKVDILANQTGSIFDTPPAELKGNIQGNNSAERTFGYFYATAQTFDRFFLYKSDLPFVISYSDCTYVGESTNYPPRCLQCSKIRNASYDRPEWF